MASQIKYCSIVHDQDYILYPIYRHSDANGCELASESDLIHNCLKHSQKIGWGSAEIDDEHVHNICWEKVKACPWNDGEFKFLVYRSRSRSCICVI